MEAICSSETSVDFQRTTRRYIPEDSTLQEKSVRLAGSQVDSNLAPPEYKSESLGQITQYLHCLAA
jgi:hypothetical protein